MLSHLVLLAFGGRGSYFEARVVLFWALLAITPLMLLQGLVSAFVGPGTALTLTGLIVFATFLLFWATGLRIAEFGKAA